MTEVDGGMEEGEVVIQDGEDAGEVSREEHNVLKADPAWRAEAVAAV